MEDAKSTIGKMSYFRNKACGAGMQEMVGRVGFSRSRAFGSFVSKVTALWDVIIHLYLSEVGLAQAHDVGH